MFAIGRPTRGGTSREHLGQVSGTKAEIRNGYGSGLPDADWQNSSKFSGLFEGTCQFIAKLTIG